MVDATRPASAWRLFRSAAVGIAAAVVLIAATAIWLLGISETRAHLVETLDKWDQARLRRSEFVDRRIDYETYFVQRVSKTVPHNSEADRRESVELTCHLARLTLAAGFDSYETVDRDRTPDLQARDGETLMLAEIRMRKGGRFSPEALRTGPLSSDEQRRMDARFVIGGLCGGR